MKTTETEKKKKTAAAKALRGFGAKKRVKTGLFIKGGPAPEHADPGSARGGGKAKGRGSAGGGSLKGGGSIGGGGGLKGGGPVGGGGGLKSGGRVGGEGGLSREAVSHFAAQRTKVANSYGLGYLPDLPDHRDHLFEEINKLADEVEGLQGDTKKPGKKFLARLEEKPADFVSLIDTGNLTPIENQGEIGSCTAQAVIGLAEYLIKTWTGTVTDLSRMFLYKATRNLMGVQGDTGAFIRTTIKAMAAFGVPPEERWPYSADLLDYEPMAFQYAYAANFKAVKYARLDGYNVPTSETLRRIKQALYAGLPVALGFPVHESIHTVTREMPLIPLPGTEEDPQLGGHAVLAVGYDDTLEVPGQTDPENPGEERKGALIIRNSWGEEWGREGYGYLPYGYVLEALAVDFWTIYSSQWLIEGRFD